MSAQFFINASPIENPLALRVPRSLGVGGSVFRDFGTKSKKNVSKGRVFTSLSRARTHSIQNCFAISLRASGRLKTPSFTQILGRICIIALSTLCLTVPRSADAGCPHASYHELTQVLHNVTPHDARLLLNLLYWSHQRSDSTLTLQTAGEKNFKAQWKAWESCSSRRLNPKAAPPVSYKSTAHDTFRSAHDGFHVIHSHYTGIINLCTDAGNYEGNTIPTFIAELRERARYEVMQVMQGYLATTARELQSYYTSRSGLTDQRGIITSLMTQFALGSFAHFDKTWNQNSATLMHTFLQIQETFNRLWHTIETARKAFYREYYNLVYELLQEQGMPDYVFTNVLITERYDAFQFPPKLS